MQEKRKGCSQAEPQRKGETERLTEGRGTDRGREGGREGGRHQRKDRGREKEGRERWTGGSLRDGQRDCQKEFNIIMIIMAFSTVVFNFQVHHLFHISFQVCCSRFRIWNK